MPFTVSLSTSAELPATPTSSSLQSILPTSTTLPPAGRPSRHPPTLSSLSHGVHTTHAALSLVGIILLSLFALGLAAGLVKCAWSYWRTPRRSLESITRRSGLQFDARWFENVLEGETLMRPPPPLYFPGPPSYTSAV